MAHDLRQRSRHQLQKSHQDRERRDILLNGLLVNSLMETVKTNDVLIISGVMRHLSWLVILTLHSGLISFCKYPMQNRVFDIL